VPDGNAGKPPNAHNGTPASLRAAAARSRRPSLGGGAPARDRELRAQGRQTVHKLLDAGLAEFDERGFQAVRVDDVVRRAKISHGTFYLYFANKEDLFKALLSDALVDMAALTDEFPVVTRNEAGQAALRRWVSAFCDTYAAHASVIRILSRAAGHVQALRGHHPGHDGRG
jgi:AcrR family transcriptional regulator